jgi:hypothetical protein
MDWFQVGTSVKAFEVHLTMLEEMKGGVAMENVLIKQEKF